MCTQVIKKNAYQHAISSTLFLFTLCTSTQLFAQSTALWPTFTKDQKSIFLLIREFKVSMRPFLLMPKLEAVKLILW